MHQKTIVVSLMFLSSLASVSAFGADVKGMIISRTGETLIVKSAQGNVTVVLTDSTTTKDDRGLFGLDKQQMSDVVLIPGLKADVEGTSDDKGRVVATTITVGGHNPETGELVHSVLHPTAEQVAATVQTLAAHKEQLAAHNEQLAAEKESVDANRQNISANKQQIQENIKDIEEHTNRFTALSEYEVKGEATVQFDVG